MKIFNLPDLGEGLTEAEVHEWHVKVGEEVKLDQPMLSVETAKAIVEVPAPRDGVIAKLHGQVGDMIDVGKPLVEFTDGEDDNAASGDDDDAGSVVGNLQHESSVITESATGVVATRASGTGHKAFPAVRALAKRLGVDISTLQGTGPNGQITKQDVEGASPSSAGANRKAPSIEGAEPLKGLRRSMAVSMSKSNAEVVPVTIYDDCDIHAWPKSTDINARIIRAICAGIEAEPIMNAWYDGPAQAVKHNAEVNLGLAMDSPDGLLVANLWDVKGKSATDLRATIKDYQQQLQERSFEPKNLMGYTIMLSNFGKFAGRYASTILVPPCVSIIGIGGLYEQVVVDNGDAQGHRTMPISLTFDHRAATGGEALRFLAAMMDDLAKAE